MHLKIIVEKFFLLTEMKLEILQKIGLGMYFLLLDCGIQLLNTIALLLYCRLSCNLASKVQSGGDLE